MNLDDLKAKLADQDAKLDNIVRLHAAGVRELALSKSQSNLRWLVSGVIGELIVTIVAAVWLGNFIAGHLWEPRFLVPVVLVDIGVMALMGSCIRQIVVIANLDYGLPVVTVQKDLGRLRVLRIRTTKWVMILSFVMWFPVIIVLLEGLLGVDAWLILERVAGRDESFFAWVVANLLFGLVVALAIVWVSNRYADRVDGSPVLKRVMDDFAGRSLTKAQSVLDSVVRFEAEP